MEPHRDDAREHRQEDAWRTVSDRFSALGRKFKEHYQSEGGGNAEPLEDEFRQALRTLGDALDRAFGSVGEALADPEVRERAKDAANSLVAAFSTTFSELSDELGKTFRRDEPSPEPPSEEAPADPSRSEDDPPAASPTR